MVAGDYADVFGIPSQQIFFALMPRENHALRLDLPREFFNPSLLFLAFFYFGKKGIRDRDSRREDDQREDKSIKGMPDSRRGWSSKAAIAHLTYFTAIDGVVTKFLFNSQ
jgi:hypothetical protein